MSEAEPKIVEVTAEEENEDDVPELEEVEDEHDHDDHEGHSHAQEGGKHKATKAEKKIKKALNKLGMKEVSGFYRVAVRNPKNQMNQPFLITVDAPDVYKMNGSDHFAVFGRIEMDNIQDNMQRQAATSFEDATADALDGVDLGGESELAGASQASGVEDTESNEDAGEAQYSEKDIQLVMKQGKLDKEAAIEKLNEHNGDLVNTIMTLSS
eukprot:TRINITY_DN1900_c0_g1_i1.p1 TRINITY_DN1900_c0_g1~~TRINITY_DN1900_c0_g1_i1.p1  ORF type:complete len:224 (+),score=91.16 TRINITY_DN1900_c0_g1_i1:41-673(+)